MAYDFDQLIDRRQSESSKWRKYDSDVIPLPVADMDFISPEPVIKALRDRIDHGLFGYGALMPEFYETILGYLEQRYGWQVEPDAIVPLPGIVAGFNLAARAMASPGEGLLLQTPLYPPMLRLPSNTGLRADLMALTQEADGRYTVERDTFASTIRPHTKAFMLCNPHNPVGRVFNRLELELMAEHCLRHDLVICSDEIHCDIRFESHRHIPIATLDPEIESRTITLMAPSKTYNLAGLKCAFTIIPNPALRESFNAQRLDLVPQSVNILGATAAIAAYRDGQAWLDEVLSYLDGNRQAVKAYVDTHLPGISMAMPEGTYLAWLDCRQARIPNDDPYTFFLEQARVGLNDGRDFGAGGTGFVRLNFGCPRSLLMQALDRMREALVQAGGLTLPV